MGVKPCMERVPNKKQILPGNKHDPTLDTPFTKEEISKGIRELKLRKASGNGSISNEMIIAGALTILHFLVTFFSEILKLPGKLMEGNNNTYP